MMLRLHIVLLGLVLLVQTPAAAPSVVPVVDEPSHHLIFENEYVRVFYVEIAPHTETQYHRHDRDYIFVALGDSSVDSVREGEKLTHLDLKYGDIRFSKGGFVHKAVNPGSKPFKVYAVELKNDYRIEGQCDLNGSCEAHSHHALSGQLTANTESIMATPFFHGIRFTMQPNVKCVRSLHQMRRGVLLIALNDLNVRDGDEWGKMKAGEYRFLKTMNYEVLTGGKQGRFIALEMFDKNSIEMIAKQTFEDSVKQSDVDSMENCSF